MPFRRGPAKDVTFFYMGSHLSELQSCALIFSTNFILFSYLNSERHNLVIELCRALKIFNFLNGSLVNLRVVEEARGGQGTPVPP